MTHDIHALSGAYAVDAVDERERAEFEEHLALCSACQTEVSSLREAAAVMAGAAVTAPPAALRARVLQQIGQVRPLPPEQAASWNSGAASGTAVPASPSREAAGVSDLGQHRARRARPARRWLAAAAAAAAVIAGGTAVLQPWNSEQGQTQVALADQVRQAPDAEHVKINFDVGGTATVYRSKSLDKAVIVTEGMAAAPSGKVYQAWLQDAEGSMVSAGVMPSGSDQTVVLEGDAADAAGAGITVEPSGGSQTPTSQPIALFAFPA